MPIYKGSTEVASGNLYKGSTEIQDGYKATDSFYVNEISISFLNFPGQADYTITGAPGATISVTRSVSWTETAPGGSAYNGTQTATGLPSGFAFAGGSQGSTSNTTTTPNVNFISSVFPSNSTSVDYNTLTISLPTTAVVSYSYTFTGGLGRSTSCTAFSGSACGVSSASASGGQWTYFTANASGTGGSGANTCSNYCSVSISSSGGSSSCNSSGQTASQSANTNMVAVPTYAVNNPTGWRSVLQCTTVNTGPVFSLCGGGQLVTARPGGAYTGGASTSSSCGTPPAYEITPPSMNGYKLVGRDLNGTDSGTWNIQYRDGQGTVRTSSSAVTP
jgi:hypothetical protein